MPSRHALSPTGRPPASGALARVRRQEELMRPLAAGAALPEAHVELIDQSHERCAALGLSRIERPDLAPLGRADLTRRARTQPAPVHHAAPVMEMLFEQIVNTRQHGGAVRRHGHHHPLDRRRRLPGARASKVALQPGVNWSRAGQGHQRHRHRAGRRDAHARACRRALHARQQFPDLLGRAHPRSARQHAGRAGRDRRPPRLPPAHDGAGEDVGAHDREPLAVGRLQQRAAAALSQPRPSSSAR